MNARNEAPALHRRLMQHDPVLGYRFEPGLKVRIPHEGGGYLVKTNRDGFRCDHNVTEKKGRAHRVLVFGDSYTAGDGVSNGKRYSDVLEQALDDTEVLNFGLSGSGTDQQYLTFRQYAERIEYDAVVISVLVENIQRNVARHRQWTDRSGAPIRVPKPWFELSPSGALALQGVPVPQPDAAGVASGPRDRESPLAGVRRLINGMGPDFKDLCQKLSRFQPVPEYGSADHPAWQLMRAILVKWASEIEVPAVIMVIPVYQHIEGTASYKHVRRRFDELAEAVRVPVYHVLDALLEPPAPLRRSFRFEHDCHLTPLAHRHVGEALAKVVAPLLEAQRPPGASPWPHRAAGMAAVHGR